MKASNIAIAALASLMPKESKKIRAELPKGVNHVDEEVTFKVKGTVSVAEDEEYTPTAEIPLKAALALFIRYSGITADAALKTLEKAMKEALEMDEDAVECIEELALIGDAEQKLMRVVNNLPKKKRKGKVTVKCTIEDLQPKTQSAQT